LCHIAATALALARASSLARSSNQQHRRRTLTSSNSSSSGSAMLTEEVTCHAGDHRGRDEVLRYFVQRREMADATFRIEVRDTVIPPPERCAAGWLPSPA